MTRHARLLSVCRSGGVLLTRNSVLASAGHDVAAAEGWGAALEALNHDFDVVVIGHLYDQEEKSALAARAHARGAKVLCMYSEAVPPRVPAADAFIHNLQGPEDLLAAIEALLQPKQARPIAP